MTIDCSGCLNGKTQKAKKKSVKTIKIKTSSPVLAKKTNQKNQFKSFFNANDQLKMSAKTTANKKIQRFTHAYSMRNGLADFVHRKKKRILVFGERVI